MIRTDVLMIAVVGVYERTGLVRAIDGSVDAITIIGEVSPTGGNFEKPVTQSTLAALRCFLGLSYDRACERVHPAIDPLNSWSRYRRKREPWLAKTMGLDWTSRVDEMIALLRRGNEVRRMKQLAGEEGVSVADFLSLAAARFLDMVYLPQDAFDAMDGSVPLDRQLDMFDRAHTVSTARHVFADKEGARQHFTRMTRLFKSLNHAATDASDFARLSQDIQTLHEGVPITERRAA